jgi:hypothetical protein
MEHAVMGIRPSAIAIVALLAACLAGCIERKETIRVAGDGTVRIRVEMVADAADELTADRVPSPEMGWRVERSERRDAAGNVQKHVLIADIERRADEPLPDRFGPAEPPLAGAELHFTTSVTTEMRRGATARHFRRIYDARPWAYVEAEEERIKESHGLDALDGRDLASFSAAERERLLRGFAEIEAARTLVFARAAFADVSPRLAPAAWLAVESSVRPVVEGLDYPTLAALLGAHDPSADSALVEAGEGFERDLRTAILTALESACGYGGDDLGAFVERLDWHQRFYQVTRDLGGERFEVTVEMPEPIVASNADEVDGRRATWRFDGTRFRDREFELLVTSEPPRDAPAEGR